jgi:hypothetical protein
MVKNKITNCFLTFHSAGWPNERWDEVMVVVRDRDQHASTSLISIPALSEPKSEFRKWDYGNTLIFTNELLAVSLSHVHNELSFRIGYVSFMIRRYIVHELKHLLDSRAQ